MPQCGHREGSGRFHHDGVLVVHLDDGRADRSFRNGDDVVQDILADPVGQLSCLLHCRSVHELVDALQFGGIAVFDGGLHAGCSGGLHADNFGVRPGLFNEGTNSGSKSASSDWNEDVVERGLHLPCDLKTDGALSLNDFLVVERWDEGLSAPFSILDCCGVCRVESVTGQHDVNVFLSEHLD